MLALPNALCKQNNRMERDPMIARTPAAPEGHP